MINISVPTNFDNDADSFCGSINKPCDQIKFCFYGSDITNPLPGGRPSYRVPIITQDRLIKHVQELKRKGHDFRYLLTGDSLCMSLKGFQNTVIGLLQAGIRSFVVRDVRLLHAIKDCCSNARVIRSLIDGDYDSKIIASYINEGYDTVSLNIHHPKFLQNLCDLHTFRHQVEILLNSCCHQGCTDSKNHYSFYEETYKRTTKQNTFFVDLQNLNCSLRFLRSPDSIIHSTFVPRGAIGHIISLEFTMFKLAGRGMPTSSISDLVSYYFDQEYNPNQNVCDIMFRGGSKFLTPFTDFIPKDLSSGIPTPTFELSDAIMSRAIISRINGENLSLKNSMTPIVRITSKSLLTQWITALSEIQDICKSSMIVDQSQANQIIQRLQRIGYI